MEKTFTITIKLNLNELEGEPTPEAFAQRLAEAMYTAGELMLSALQVLDETGHDFEV